MFRKAPHNKELFRQKVSNSTVEKSCSDYPALLSITQDYQVSSYLNVFALAVHLMLQTICIYTCIYTNIHLYTHMHTHIHTHRHTRTQSFWSLKPQFEYNILRKAIPIPLTKIAYTPCYFSVAVLFYFLVALSLFENLLFTYLWDFLICSPIVEYKSHDSMHFVHLIHCHILGDTAVPYKGA